MTELRIDEANLRLDLLLSKLRAEHSRAYWQKAIERGEVLIDGKKVRASYRVSIGEILSIAEVAPTNLEIEPEDIPLDVLYEDSDIIVINKPRGMTVHPAVGISSGTLVNALLFHCRDLSGINGVMRPGIVHRLDKDTSGVMVAAKNDRAHLNLAEQIGSKSARKIYLAIVHGRMTDNVGIINGAIGRSKLDRKKMAITSDGKSATTEFRVLERFRDYTLVECRLLTGRTHQIRVHLTSIGHPLIGDPKYGQRRNEFPIEGQALHSSELALTHPTTGELMKFNAPLPNDMNEILRRLRAEHTENNRERASTFMTI